MRNVYLVSHCESIHHVEKLGGGWYDTGLTDLGRTQAEKTGKYLQSIIESEVRIMSSDLKRAKETAVIIGEILGHEVELDEGFREMNYGIVGGKPHAWIEKLEIPEIHEDTIMDYRIYEGAESRRDIGTRVNKALKRALDKDSRDLIIVSHGFATTFLIYSWLIVPVEHMGFGNFPSKPGCVSHLQIDDRYNNRGIKFLCYTRHLEG